MRAIRQTEEIIERTAFALLPIEHYRGIGDKPNAIVRPLRHNCEPTEGRYHHQVINIHPDYKTLYDLESQIIQKVKQTNYNNNNGKKTTTDSNNNQQSIHKLKCNEFTKELDAKLRKLHYDSSNQSSKHGSLQDVDKGQRPRFVTTVPKGVFLEPSKEPPVPAPSAAQIRRVYSYASRPKVLYNNNNNDDLQPNRNLGETTCHRHPCHHKSRENLPDIGSKPKSRDNSTSSYQNVMHDRRVVRGSNYTINHPQLGDGENNAQKEADARRKKLIRRHHILTKNQRGIIGTPPPVKGRKHENVQTEKYLEELYARPPEMDASCQTDLFLHRPPSPPYVPAKIGCDISTEIADGDLFDFDAEVQPVVEALVGRTIEQALIEVLHEEELAEMKMQQQRIIAMREAELAELKRLERIEQRLAQEKERRKAQDKIAVQLDREMQERITASKLIQGHIADLLPDVLDSIDTLKEIDNREKVEKHIRPWLAEEVAQEIGQMIDSRELLEQIVREVLNQRADVYLSMAKEEDEKEKHEESKEDEDKDNKENEEEKDEENNKEPNNGEGETEMENPEEAGNEL